MNRLLPILLFTTAFLYGDKVTFSNGFEMRDRVAKKYFDESALKILQQKQGPTRVIPTGSSPCTYIGQPVVANGVLPLIAECGMAHVIVTNQVTCPIMTGLAAMQLWGIHKYATGCSEVTDSEAAYYTPKRLSDLVRVTDLKESPVLYDTEIMKRGRTAHDRSVTKVLPIGSMVLFLGGEAGLLATLSMPAFATTPPGVFVSLAAILLQVGGLYGMGTGSFFYGQNKRRQVLEEAIKKHGKSLTDLLKEYGIYRSDQEQETRVDDWIVNNEEDETTETTPLLSDIDSPVGNEPLFTLYGEDDIIPCPESPEPLVADPNATTINSDYFFRN